MYKNLAAKDFIKGSNKELKETSKSINRLYLYKIFCKVLKCCRINV